jgi:hypothetical protein
MFIAYKNIAHLGKKDGKDTWLYALIDSEFRTICSDDVGMVVAVIQEYSKRKLNVAANLAIALVWFNKQYPDYSIQLLIDLNREHNPLFPPYEKDLQKYLVLL